MRLRSPRCYISCSLEGTHSDIADQMAATPAALGWKPYVPHRDTAAPGDSTAAVDVFDRNLSAVLSSDCVLVETTASLGVGIELMMAHLARRPVVLFEKEGRYLSRMVTGLLADPIVESYRTPTEITDAVSRSLGEVRRRARRRAYPGPLIVLEGADGVGKSEATSRLAGRMRAEGVEVTTSSDPPKIDPWTGLRRVFHETTGLDRYAEALVFQAARADNTRRMLVPSLESGRTVIMDRYSLSWLAYQDVQLRATIPVARERVRWLLLMSALAGVGHSLLEPDLTIVLQASEREAARRRGTRAGAESKFETTEFQVAVRASYTAFVDAIAGDVLSVDTTGLGLEQVGERVHTAVKEWATLRAAERSGG